MRQTPTDKPALEPVWLQGGAAAAAARGQAESPEAEFKNNPAENDLIWAKAIAVTEAAWP